MNKTLIAMALGLTSLAATPAFAHHPGPLRGQSYIDEARVVDVEPLVRYVRVAEPRQECWDEEVVTDYEVDEDDESATPMILGGIIGGVVGHTMGKGRGRDAATIAGTILGGSIGRDIGRQNHRPRRVPAHHQRTRCRTVNDYHEEERIDGYRVTYRYRGHEFVTRMPHKPGRHLQVRVRVQPLP